MKPFKFEIQKKKWDKLRKRRLLQGLLIGGCSALAFAGVGVGVGYAIFTPPRTPEKPPNLLDSGYVDLRSGGDMVGDVKNFIDKYHTTWNDKFNVNNWRSWQDNLSGMQIICSVLFLAMIDSSFPTGAADGGFLDYFIWDEPRICELNLCSWRNSQHSSYDVSISMEITIEDDGLSGFLFFHDFNGSGMPWEPLDFDYCGTFDKSELAFGGNMLTIYFTPDSKNLFPSSKICLWFPQEWFAWNINE